MQRTFVLAGLVLALTACVMAAAEDFDLDLHPYAVQRCLDLSHIRSRAEVTRFVNPYYLRGDLDGDGKADYAVAVKGKRSGLIRVLVCLADGTGHLLGREQEEPLFSDYSKDDYFPPVWMLYTVDEAKQIGESTTNEPARLPVVRGEVIALWREDGFNAIYWDGTKFCYAPTPRD